MSIMGDDKTEREREREKETERYEGDSQRRINRYVM